MKRNRATDTPRLGLPYRTGSSLRDEKRHAFEKFYKGWRDYMESRPIFAPPSWSEADRQWYQWGCEKAKTERRQAKELVPTGYELPRCLYSRVAEKAQFRKPPTAPAV